MDRGRHVFGQVGFGPLAALLRDAELAAEEGLRRRCSEADEHVRADDGELRLQPRTARGQLAPARLRVDAALAPRLPLEVLDRVRHVGRSPVDARLHERLVQESAGGAYEWCALPVLTVAGLLAD